MNLHVVVLAAGQGTRMFSSTPKVLHQLGGKPLLAHVIDRARQIDAAEIHVVHGHGGAQVCAAIDDATLHWVEQTRQLGTGHAVLQAIPTIQDDATVMVLYGDVPLIRAETLQMLLRVAEPNTLALLTATLDNPAGYGRILRDGAGRVLRIVEEKDATAEQRKTPEINTGILAAAARDLKNWLARLTNHNAQGEYYLTDIVGLAVSDGAAVLTAQPNSLEEILGVNNRQQLAHLERHYQRQRAHDLMLTGVTLRDPARFDVRGALRVGRDVTIDVDVVFEGDVDIADHVTIGPFSFIRNCRIGSGATILSHCVIEDAIIGAGTRVGPYARIRPGTILDEGAHVGNFVEVKNASIGRNSKVNHLSYVGDATVGKDVNIGAGTITCNYDGANKHHTHIEDNVFVGSDTQLVAPVRVRRNATIGAGTTVTKDVPEDMLVISRVPQQVKAGWKRPTKKKPTI